MVDLVIIDGTPCELVTDAVILSRIADATVIVTAHKITKKDALERVVKNIKNVGGKIAGVVINKVPVSAKKYGEKYYYYGEDKILSGKSKKEKKENPNDNNIKKDLDIQYEKDFLREDNEPLFPFKEQEEQQTEQEEQQGQQEKLEDKTNEILRQINEYLDNEKKNL